MRPTTQEYWAIFAAAGSLALGFAIIWGLPAKTSTAAVTALFVAPVLVYAIGSGRLSEFSAPGGWRARFAQAAITPLTSFRGVLDRSDFATSLIAKGAPEQIPLELEQIRDARPVVLTLTLGGDYLLDHMKSGLGYLSTARRFQALIVLRDDESLVAYALADQAIRLFRSNSNDQASRFLKAIKDKDTEFIIRHPSVLNNYVTSGATLSETLRSLDECYLPCISVIDGSNKKFLGVLERERVNSMLLERLISQQEQQAS